MSTSTTQRSTVPDRQLLHKPHPPPMLPLRRLKPGHIHIPIAHGIFRLHGHPIGVTPPQAGHMRLQQPCGVHIPGMSRCAAEEAGGQRSAVEGVGQHLAGLLAVGV